MQKFACIIVKAYKVYIVNVLEYYKMKIIPISLTETQYRRLKDEKHRTGVSMSCTVRLALIAYFGGEEHG